MTDVPEGIGIAKRYIGGGFRDLQSDLSVGECGGSVSVHDAGYGKLGRG